MELPLFKNRPCYIMNKIKKSLRASFWDGIFAFMMVGFTQDYVAPYALALKATVKEIGLLSSLPNLCASFIQLKSADLVDAFSSRKRIILISVYLQALSALPLLLIPYLFKSNQALWLIFFAMLFRFRRFKPGALGLADER